MGEIGSRTTHRRRRKRNVIAVRVLLYDSLVTHQKDLPMEQSTENRAEDASAAPPSPSPIPPPLPQQMKRFRVACWLGIGGGGLLALSYCAMLVGFALTPGPPTPVWYYLAVLISALQAISSWLLLKGRQSVIPIFAVSAVAGTFGHLAFGFFPFALLAFAPLLILLLGTRQKSPSSPIPTAEKAETGQPDTQITPLAKGEDLY